MCSAAVVAGFNIGLFFPVTEFLVGPYIAETGALVHDTPDTNKALVHLVAQGGGLGGTLFVLQVVTNYVGHGDTRLLIQHGVQDYFLYALATRSRV